MNNKVRAGFETAKIVVLGAATGILVTGLITVVGLEMVSLGLMAVGIGMLMHTAYKIELDKLNHLDKLNKNR